jgi:hypothetical protein
LNRLKDPKYLEKASRSETIMKKLKVLDAGGDEAANRSD